MVQRPIGMGAPQCAKCGKSVYMAEQVIGPYSKPYHKPCLTCKVCNKRLDSTLLLEHDGEPYCKNCHKTHLGQGKGGFGLAVPLRPEKPVALQAKPFAGNGHAPPNEASRRAEERLNEELSGINISRRNDNASPVLREPDAPSYCASRQTNLSSKPTTVAQSIDHLVASGVDVPVPYTRSSGASSRVTEALYGQEHEPVDVHTSYDSLPRADPAHRPPSPLKQSYTNDAYEEPQWSSSTAHESTTSAPRPHSPYKPAKSSLTAEPCSTPSLEREADSFDFIHMADIAGALPTPQRKDPIALAREREKGLQYDASRNAAKTYSPRTTPVSPGRSARDGLNGDGFGYSPNSALSKMGLGSTVSAAAVGTPLCARCERPVYFAEQKQAAARKWHRACLRCDGCSTTLESGKLEEGPLSATYKFPTNIWCRTCYAKRFGPKGIGVAGMSLPETMR